MMQKIHAELLPSYYSTILCVRLLLHTHTLHFILSGFTGAYWDAIQTYLSTLIQTQFSATRNEKAGKHIQVQSSLSHLVPSDLQYHLARTQSATFVLGSSLLILRGRHDARFEVMAKGQLNLMHCFITKSVLQTKKVGIL